jgi:hypothetical protein
MIPLYRCPVIGRYSEHCEPQTWSQTQKYRCYRSLPHPIPETKWNEGCPPDKICGYKLEGEEIMDSYTITDLECKEVELRRAKEQHDALEERMNVLEAEIMAKKLVSKVYTKEQVVKMLNKLEDVAIIAIHEVGYANYKEREQQALRDVREMAQELRSEL